MFMRISQHQKKLMGLAFAAAFMAFLAYLPSLRNGFINWDDDIYVYENPDIRVFGARFLSRVFTAYVAYNWHPLTIISYALDYLFMGLHPFVYHLTNIIFHALNTLLVAVLTFRLAERAAPHGAEADLKPYGTTPALAASFVTALLFGLHPLHVESVAWISERKDVLYSFFFLLSTFAYLKYASALAPKRYLNYALALLFFALSIMSKPMAVSLPVVLLVLDYYPLNRFAGFKKNVWDSRWLFFEKVPFFILSLLSAILTVQAQKSSIAPMNAAGPMMRISVAVRAYIFYLYKMIVPLKLAPLYPYPEQISFLSLEYSGSFIVFAGISVFSVLISKKYKIFLAIWIYYLITLLPVIGLVQVGSQAAADRYTYLPSLGPFMLAGVGVGCFFENAAREMHGAVGSSAIKKILSPVIVAAAGITLSIFSYSTLKQQAIWKDPLTFWNYEIREFPGAFGAYHNRGIVYMDRHDYSRAIDDLNKAIALNPSPFMLSYYSRGKVYQMKGDDLMALKDFKTATELNPRSSKPYNDLGVSYGKLGQYDMAIKAFDKAVELDQKFEEAYNNRGYTYLKMGKYNKAVDDMRKALKIDPENAGACYNLGSAYSKLGDVQQSEFYFKKASGLSGKTGTSRLK